ncbi:MAG: hypothetical protein EBZ48_08440 [Proteobacteria bacterium]|nr:hypothetical protein [Pseudomonadota bacterium]
MLAWTKLVSVDLSQHSASGICAAPSLINSAVCERFQISKSTGVSKDYLNKFAAVIALLQMTPEFLPDEVIFPRVNQSIATIPEYGDFVHARFGQLKLGEIQPGISPEDLIFLARPQLSSLSAVVATLKAVRLDTTESMETTSSKVCQIGECVSLMRGLIILGPESQAPIGLNPYGRAA